MPELGRTRPDLLLEVRPQEKVQRHTVDQIVDAVSPTLDVLVPVREEQLVAVLTHFDLLFPEQVIEMPTISSPPRVSRTVLSEPQSRPLTFQCLFRLVLEVFKVYPLAGGTCCVVSQQCTGTFLDGAMGSYIWCGCFLLVHRGERGAGECVFPVYPLTQKLSKLPPVEAETGPAAIRQSSEAF